MKITIETDGGDIKVSGMEGVPREIAEKAARIGALNAGAAPASMGSGPDTPSGSVESAQGAMDAGPAPKG